MAKTKPTSCSKRCGPSLVVSSMDSQPMKQTQTKTTTQIKAMKMKTDGLSKYLASLVGSGPKLKRKRKDRDKKAVKKEKLESLPLPLKKRVSLMERDGHDPSKNVEGHWIQEK